MTTRSEPLPRDEDGHEPPDRPFEVRRLGSTEDFTGIVLFLAERAPEPWATQLYSIALTGKRAA